MSSCRLDRSVVSSPPISVSGRVSEQAGMAVDCHGLLSNREVLLYLSVAGGASMASHAHELEAIGAEPRLAGRSRRLLTVMSSGG